MNIHTHKYHADSTHHGNPAEGRHTFADGWEVVEEWRGAVLLSERLHLLNHFRHWSQQRCQNGLRPPHTCDKLDKINCNKSHLHLIQLNLIVILTTISNLLTSEGFWEREAITRSCLWQVKACFIISACKNSDYRILSMAGEAQL